MAFIHGVKCILQEIQNDLRDRHLAAVDSQLGIDLGGIQSNGVHPATFPTQVNCLADHIPHASGSRRVARSIPGNVLQTSDDAAYPLRCFHDPGARLLQIGNAHLPFPSHFQQITGIGVDDAEGIVDLMCNASCHHSQGGQTCGGCDLHAASFQLRLHLFPGADIADRTDHQNVVFGLQWAQADFDRKFRTIFPPAVEQCSLSHRSRAVLGRERVAVFPMNAAKSFRNQYLDLLAQQFLGPITE